VVVSAFALVAFLVVAIEGALISRTYFVFWAISTGLGSTSTTE
jgi:hypothetical protein